MRFLHTADWHLGRPFHHASLEQDQRYALNQISTYAKDFAVDAVVIAGDIYDRAVPPRWAVELLDDVLHRLCVELDLPVVVIPGNHDSAERLGFGARQLQQANLHIVSRLDQITRPVVISDDAVECHFYCLPYCDPVQVSHQFDEKLTTHNEAHAYLVNRIKAGMKNNVANILVSHCFVAGSAETESERPLSVGGADAVTADPLMDFSYVALGHLHGPQRRSKDSIRYSGSLLKYSFSEAQQNKGVTLVEIDESFNAAIQNLPLIPQREVRVLEGEMEALLEAGRTDAGSDDYLLIRLTDKGALLNAMARLRDVYPNVMHLERPGLLDSGETVPLSRSMLQRGELAMFQDFFRQTTGDQMTTAEEAIITQTLKELMKEPVE